LCSADDKVPHRQSVEVVEALKESGCTVVYDEREGKDHSFDASEEEEMGEMWQWIVDKLNNA